MNRAQLLLFAVFLFAASCVDDAARTFAQATPAHRAALIVQHGEGRTETYCARFSEDAITGEQMLRRVGLTTRMEATTMGYAVCMIGEQGCRFPAESCFCRCQTLGADCTFWNYLQRIDGVWRAVPAGISAPIVVDGSVFAWSWDAGDGENAPASLPPLDVDVVCGRTPTAEPTAEPTADRRPPTAEPTTDDGRRTTAEPTAEPTADRRPPTAEPTTDDGRRTTAEPNQGLLAFVATAAVLLGALFRLRSTRGKS